MKQHKIYTIFKRNIRSVKYNILARLQKNDKLYTSTSTIDVIIPAIEKNLKSLPLCIHGIRTCVTEKISNIYIVAPDVPAFRKLCTDENTTFVDEITVLGYSPKTLNLVTASGLNRSGWMFQQFLKLSGNIGTEKNYLVCDADHILIRPHTFISEDKYIFYQSKECHTPYYDNIKKLIGLKKFSRFSYVDHKMIFNKDILNKLKHEIEQKYKMNWDKAILNSLDLSSDSPFSEYELYGNYISDKCKIKTLWLNKNLHNRDTNVSYKDLQHKYSKKYRAITFPGYKEFA